MNVTGAWSANPTISVPWKPDCLLGEASYEPLVMEIRQHSYSEYTTLNFVQVL